MRFSANQLVYSVTLPSHNYVSPSSLNSTFLNIVSSGQARLVRATTEGGSGIHIIHGMSSSDSDDDEDFDEDFAYHNGKVASPPGIVDPWAPKNDYYVSSPYIIGTFYSKQAVRKCETIKKMLYSIYLKQNLFIKLE